MATLYVLQAKGTDIYKIGATRRAVPDRIKQLKVGCPFPLEVVCTHDAEDAFGLERGFHHYFHDKRLEGEWFSLSEADVETIRRDCEAPPVPLLEEEEDEADVDEADVDEEDREGGGADTSAQRHVQLQPSGFYLALPLFAVIGFITLNATVGVVASEHLGNLWFIAFVITLLLLVDSYRRRAQERQQRNLSPRLFSAPMYVYLHEVVVHPEQVARQIRKRSRSRSRRLARGKLRGAWISTHAWPTWSPLWRARR